MASIPSEPADYGFLSSPTFPKAPHDSLNIYEMGANDLANYFITMISRKWGETQTTQDLRHVPMDVGILPSWDELVVYNPHKNCLYKFRVGKVPDEIVRKLEGLANAHDFGVGCFGQLCEVLKKAVQDNAISENPEEEYGKGVEGAVAMLSKLSLQVGPRSGSNYTMVSDTRQIKVHVVLVDGLGESHRYSHFLRADTDLKSFLEHMDKKFSKYCDPYNEWAYKNWDMRIQELKRMGLDGDPSLGRIEGLVALHKAAENNEFPQWMYYTILGGVDGEEIDIQDEQSYKAVMDRAANPEAPACLMRIAEAKFRNIFVELRFLEEKQLAMAWIEEQTACVRDKEDDQDELQQPGDGVVEDKSANDDGDDDDFSFDPEPYYSLSYFYNLGQDSQMHVEGQRQHDDSLGGFDTPDVPVETDPFWEDT